jgi:hypothetical protein
VGAKDDNFKAKGDPFAAFRIGDEVDLYLPEDRVLIMRSDEATLAELEAARVASGGP